jgi:hypothetical protein
MVLRRTKLGALNERLWREWEDTPTPTIHARHCTTGIAPAQPMLYVDASRAKCGGRNTTNVA